MSSGMSKWALGDQYHRVLKIRQKLEPLEFICWDCAAPDLYYTALARIRDLEKSLRKQYKYREGTPHEGFKATSISIYPDEFDLPPSAPSTSAQ